MVVIKEAIERFLYPWQSAKGSDDSEGHKLRNALREELGRIMRDTQKGRIAEKPLMVERDGRCTFSLLYPVRVELSLPEGYGLLDLYGRQPGFHSRPIEIGDGEVQYIHPNVLREYRDVVFEAVEVYHNGERQYVEWRVKRRTSQHDGLFDSGPTKRKGSSPPPDVDPDFVSLEAKLGVPY